MVSVFLFAIIISVDFIKTYDNDSSLIYDKAHSFHSEFYVESNKVIFKESIRIVNTKDQSVGFKIIGNYKDDYKSDLITSQYIKGYRSVEMKNDKFEIGANTNETYEVYFIGDKGSFTKKADRNPPRIILETIKE